MYVQVRSSGHQNDIFVSSTRDQHDMYVIPGLTGFKVKDD